MQTNDTGRASTVWRYSVSSKGISAGTLVYEEPNAAMSLAVWRTRDAQYMVLQGASDSASYIRVLRVLDVSNTAGAQPDRPELCQSALDRRAVQIIFGHSVWQAAPKSRVEAAVDKLPARAKARKMLDVADMADVCF
jgi:hypothetical protein